MLCLLAYVSYYQLNGNVLVVAAVVVVAPSLGTLVVAVKLATVVV